jgi:hypothetical protein
MSDQAASSRDATQATAWLLVGALGFVWLFPMLLLRGMSLDGVVYATISRNLAVGLGDAWHLIYTATEREFCDSPPLALVLQSGFFRLLGDHWWVERLYSVATLLPTGCLIVLIWRQLLAFWPRLLTYAWLPMLLWVSMPAWPWIYRNNLLENTLGIFTALAVYASLRAMANTRWWAVWTVLAAASIVAAVLTKGPVGLFPAVTPSVIWLTLRQQTAGRSLVVQLTLLGCLAALTAWVLADPVRHEFLSEYFQKQIVSSLQGRRETVSSPLGQGALLWTLVVQDLLPGAAMAAACVVWARGRRMETAADGLGPAGWFCLLTAASASIPIMISPKQSAYYAAPSWPFYTMALALWCLPAVDAILRRAAQRAGWNRATWWTRFAALTTMGLVVGLSPCWAGRYHRDRSLGQDVEEIARVVEPHATIAIPQSMEHEWSLQAYLFRWHYISLEVTEEPAPGAFQLNFAAATEVPENLELASHSLALYRLYRPSGTTALLGGAATSR